ELRIDGEHPARVALHRRTLPGQPLDPRALLDAADLAWHELQAALDGLFGSREVSVVVRVVREELENVGLLRVEAQRLGDLGALLVVGTQRVLESRELEVQG